MRSASLWLLVKSGLQAAAVALLPHSSNVSRHAQPLKQIRQIDASESLTARMPGYGVTAASNPARGVIEIKLVTQGFLSINQSQHSCNHGCGEK